MTRLWTILDGQGIDRSTGDDAAEFGKIIMILANLDDCIRPIGVRAYILNALSGQYEGKMDAKTFIREFISLSEIFKR